MRTKKEIETKLKEWTKAKKRVADWSPAKLSEWLDGDVGSAMPDDEILQTVFVLRWVLGEDLNIKPEY